MIALRFFTTVEKIFLLSIMGVDVTLIVCLKAIDCIVIAADSLTSIGNRIVSCTTKKLHKVAPDAVTAGCGLARVHGNNWQQILGCFPVQPSSTVFATTLSNLNSFFDKIIGQVSKSNIGACKGGNTFLLAGYDAANSGMAVGKLTRLGDRRQFEPVTMVSRASNQNYIEWIGDTTAVVDHIEVINALYVPSMEQQVAVDFAIDAIIGGITASQNAGNHTIGGDFVSVALVSNGSVTFSQHPTGIPCTTAVLPGSSPPAPHTPPPLAN